MVKRGIFLKFEGARADNVEKLANEGDYPLQCMLFYVWRRASVLDDITDRGAGRFQNLGGKLKRVAKGLKMIKNGTVDENVILMPVL